MFFFDFVFKLIRVCRLFFRNCEKSILKIFKNICIQDNNKKKTITTTTLTDIITVDHKKQNIEGKVILNRTLFLGFKNIMTYKFVL